MSRRQTLGALSPAALNSRSMGPMTATRVAAGKDGVQGSSLGAGGLAAALTANNAKSRKSMLPTTDNRPNAAALGLDTRRSSAFGGKPAGPKQDPRPLNDKNFLNNCIRTVITYLSTHGFPAAVSPKTLASPTAKDFTLIVQFLFQRFDPNMKTFGKIEDDVPMFFKRLNYPFQISKSALFAVGSPHSWPAVLAALTWLVELLVYNEKTEESASGGIGLVDEESKTKREFFEYISTSYRFFLSGDDMRCQAVDEEMLSQVRERERAIVEQHNKVKEANAAVLAELERMRTEPSPLTVAKQRHEEHLVDSDKFEKLIENLQALKQSLQRKLAERQADLKAKQDAMAAAQTENEALRARVAAQPVNKADLQRMIMERTKQKEVLDSVISQCEEMERKVHQQEVQTVSELKVVEGNVVRYNQLAHRLKLVPASAKRADGITYEMRINRDAGSAHEFSNLDLKGVIRPGLERLSELYRTKAAELSQDLLSLKEQHTARVEAIAEKQEENMLLEQQINRMEKQLREAREAQEERVRAEAGRADLIKDEVVRLRSAASSKLAEVEAHKRAALAEAEQQQRTCEAELARLKGELRAALELMVSHRMWVQQRLEATLSAVNQVHAEVQQQPIPQLSL
mmetsp:Transcript_33184/g.73361  ORF Transcript_33184/g.73361 Transcript_33184/m.73361 type:complete len:629 (+) Transcript_33184:314-2200(+)|eukprot:CAMPEP_0202895196 /NCGR_PEP_ID=MMETSP1392-20130828/4447_1 /ASSEMBLY_ACC=CAM_ASM_000868 /TAXON_ID=225041 /ORGANISM="Chlamydomonas chlamydogama, Strain SAG 11-48b" /LENGTH=628 /DNA_ID=CAMNT_0049580121 /DNA_START=249 /DNA_END=2135 /DNA_ORIENTATION=+